MVINLPASADFERIAGNCLFQAFNIIYETDKHVFDFAEKRIYQDVWEHSQGKLNTAVILIHQGIEAFMKAGVCLTSPWLLLEGKRTEWPVLPNQKDKDFNDLYTIPGEALLHTFAATAPVPLSVQLLEHINDIRKLRNQIVHGLPKAKLFPKVLIGIILDTYTYFRLPGAWWESFFDQHLLHPYSKFYGFGIEVPQFAERLDYVEASIGKAAFAKHFLINTKSRRYFCPICKIRWEEKARDEYEYKWGFLRQDANKESAVVCLNCGIDMPVTREPCYYEECKGSVIFYGDKPIDIICLTCGRQQFSNGVDESEEASNAANLTKWLPNEEH
jgi:hypothetical protein